jgi:choline dehydrogenase
MRPTSRGYIKLKSSNSDDRPLIQPNLLSDPKDLEDLKNCVRLTAEVLNSKPFEKNRKRNLNFNHKMLSDDNLLEEWLRKNLESAYHCVGTCAMGKVTEHDGRVKGVKRLRVCDASLMPDLVSGNTNAPVIMMAEKISDMIKGVSLTLSEAPVYFADNWKTNQR